MNDSSLLNASSNGWVKSIANADIGLFLPDWPASAVGT